MGIDLDALANELRAAGGNVRVSESMLCLELPYDLMAPLKTVVVVHDNGAVTLSMDEQGRPRSTVYVDQKLNAALAIIARHFGAGHPVAADRAALVDMFIGALSRYGLLAGDEQLRPEVADTLIAVVEAAGWGPRAEPVAPPEPLSAGEIAAMEVAIVDADEQFSFIDVKSGESLARREVMAVLAALPARHAVPVEGA